MVITNKVAEHAAITENGGVIVSEYRYSLTRVCLASGRLTLPKRLAELFPDKGDITAIDVKSGETLTLQIRPPRYLDGLGRFFRRHDLEVNDDIIIDPLEDGRFAFSVKQRPRKPKEADQDTARRLADLVIDVNTPLSEAEIRSLAGNVAEAVDVSLTLGSDPRLEKVQGRWQARRAAPEIDTATDSATDTATDSAPDTSTDTAIPARPAAATPTAEGSKPQPTTTHPITTAGEHQVADTATSDAADLELIELEGMPDFDPEEEQEHISEHVKAVPRTQSNDMPQHLGLNSRDTRDVSSYSRARSYVSQLGFRVETLSRDQFIANADLGRHHYSVLVHPLSEGGRLDWGSLLTQRREVASTYLAVLGHKQDLTRLTSPAAAARATCWSWDALETAIELAKSVPISPFDLESHFAKDGLIADSMTRFKANVNQRIAERGIFSAVLRSLAAMKAPSVFMLDEVIEATTMRSDASSEQHEMMKAQVLAVLERLSHAPFQLVSRVDHGEFCLRYSVSEGLLHLSEYALSLRAHLPSRRTERLSGLPESDSNNEESTTTDTVQALRS